MKKDLYENAKKALRKDIKKFLREQENDFDKFGLSGDAFDTDTNEGYANTLLNKAVNLL